MSELSHLLNERLNYGRVSKPVTKRTSYGFFGSDTDSVETTDDSDVEDEFSVLNSLKRFISPTNDETPKKGSLLTPHTLVGVIKKSLEATLKKEYLNIILFLWNVDNAIAIMTDEEVSLYLKILKTETKELKEHYERTTIDLKDYKLNEDAFFKLCERLKYDRRIFSLKLPYPLQLPGYEILEKRHLDKLKAALEISPYVWHVENFPYRVTSDLKLRGEGIENSINEAIKKLEEEHKKRNAKRERSAHKNEYNQTVKLFSKIKQNDTENNAKTVETPARLKPLSNVRSVEILNSFESVYPTLVDDEAIETPVLPLSTSDLTKKMDKMESQTAESRINYSN